MFERIIVVDDGSTDDSLAVLNKLQLISSRLEVITKSNGGQLSAMNAGIELLEDEDFVCFLDSDDSYKPGYTLALERELDQSLDALYISSAKYFDRPLHSPDGDASEANIRTTATATVCPGPYSALVRNCWIGSSTSGLAMPVSTFRKISPSASSQDWRIRADDVLILGASFLNLQRIVVRRSFNYRMHDSNNFAGQKRSLKTKALRELAVFRLFLNLRDVSWWSLLGIWNYKPHRCDFAKTRFRLLAPLKYPLRMAAALTALALWSTPLCKHSRQTKNPISSSRDSMIVTKQLGQNKSVR